MLHLDDAVGSKTTALLGRALPRDFIDVAATLDRYSRRQLLELAITRDRVLRIADAALAARQLDRLHDAQFLPHQLSDQDAALRDRFSSCPQDAGSDDEAYAVHDAAHRPPPQRRRARRCRPAHAGRRRPAAASAPHASPPASPSQQPYDEQSRRRR